MNIISIIAVTGIVAVGMYFAYRRFLGETSESSDDDVPKLSSQIRTETSSVNNIKKQQKFMAIGAVIKEFSEWKITTFDIKTYSSTVSLATHPKTTDDQVIQSVCTGDEECNLEDDLVYTLNNTAVDLLAYYALHHEKKYLDTAERLVKIIFENKLKDYDPTKIRPILVLKLMLLIGNLPILFEYIADDSAYYNTRYSCHEFINKVIPNFIPSSKGIFSKEAVIYNPILMLSNYLFNSWSFAVDSADKNMQHLIDRVVKSGLKSYTLDNYDNTLRSRLFQALMINNH